MDERPPMPEASPPAPDRPPPDAGSPFAARIALAVILLAGTLIFAFQQLAASGGGKPETTQRKVEPPDPADIRAFSLKALVRVMHIQDGRPAGPAPQGWARTSLLDNVDAVGEAPEDRLRAAIVAAEIVDAPAAVERLEKVKADLDDPDGKAAGLSPDDRLALAQDASSLLALYKDGDPLDPGESKELRARHGYFGRLAEVYGKPEDPERTALVKGGEALAAFLIGVVVFFVGLALAVFASVIAVIIMLITGRIRPAFRPPTPGGSVYIETVAAFCISFVLLKVGHILAEWGGVGSATTITFAALAVQILTASLVLWPVFRGVGFSRWRREVGLHTGKGVIPEVFFGLLGYLAGFPLVLLGGLIAAALQQRFGGGAPPSSPVLEGVAQGGFFLVLIFGLATLWAPTVEELLFRGSLYRHLRGTLGVAASAILTAFLFGILHGYQWFALGPVMAIGFNFALLREWRESLVGPMVMHALNNATVLLLVLTLFSLMKD